MPRLIVGHTTESSTRIWVRGSKERPRARVRVLDPVIEAGRTRDLVLDDWHFYTGVADFNGLRPDAEHRVEVELSGADDPPERVSGVVRTFASGPGAKLRFLLGSCNLHSLGPILDPEPVFKRLVELAEAERPAFMIHAGDQVYGDAPLPPPLGVTHQWWRDKYLDAWGTPSTRKLLSTLPHYMVLDDHEIVNNFSNDMARIDVKFVKDSALKAYREFQHLHNPQDLGAELLHYTFRHGDVHFFAMDVRSERYRNEPGNQMISQGQMRALKAWLLAHKDAVKFVISAVPFVAEVLNSGDKWNGKTFLAQRGEILDFVAEHGIRGLVFLTDDMHSVYHAVLRFSDPLAPLVHELMSSPLNQIQVSSKNYFQDPPPGRTTPDKKLTYQGQVHEFFGEEPNVMAVEVQGREVRFRVHCTRRDKNKALQGSFVV